MNENRRGVAFAIVLPAAILIPTNLLTEILCRFAIANAAPARLRAKHFLQQTSTGYINSALCIGSQS